MANVKPVPEGLHTVTPHLVVKGGVKAIDFYRKAFGAEEKFRALSPDGRVMHAELRIGNSTIFLSDEYAEIGSKGPGAGQSPVTLQLYIENVDEWFNRAVSAGASVRMPLMDAFWGDRYGQVIDPFNHTWALATHKEEVSAPEMERRLKQQHMDPKEMERLQQA